MRSQGTAAASAVTTMTIINHKEGSSNTVSCNQQRTHTCGILAATTITSVVVGAIDNIAIHPTMPARRAVQKARDDARLN